jgi:hypothetical protein
MVYLPRLVRFFGIVAAPVLLQAQDPTPTNLQESIRAVTDQLFGASTLTCNFTRSTQATWLGPTDQGSDSMPTVRQYSGQRFLLTFAGIDTVRSRATLIGNQGSAVISVVTSGPGLTFMEVTSAGNVMLTTVFAAYAKGTRSFIATHSRHLGMGVATLPPMPSQYHGTCSWR